MIKVIVLSLLLVTMSATGAQEERGGFGYFGPSHADVDQSRVVKVPLPQANPLKQKKHKRLKHPRCDPDTQRCRW